MTSPLRRKRPTTAPGRSTPTRTAASLLALLLAAAPAAAQGYPSARTASSGYNSSRPVLPPRLAPLPDDTGAVLRAQGYSTPGAVPSGLPTVAFRPPP